MRVNKPVVYHQTMLALGSTCEITLVCSRRSDERIAQFFAKLWLDIAKFERQFSRFLPNSELSRINTGAGVETPISPACYELLNAAKQAAQKTSDAFNPFILPALQRAGYVNSRVPGDEQEKAPNYSERAVVPSDRLKLEENEETVPSVTIPYNTALDLGGCGKGYLAGMLQKTLRETGLDGYWVSLGGDIVGAGHNEQGETWPVAIAAGPDEPPYLSIRMPESEFAIATSGTSVHSGKEWHHLIDTSTEEPSETQTVSATVIHDAPLWADVLASIAVTTAPKDMEAFRTKFDIKTIITKSKNGQVTHYGQTFEELPC